MEDDSYEENDDYEEPSKIKNLGDGYYVRNGRVEKDAFYDLFTLTGKLGVYVGIPLLIFLMIVCFIIAIAGH